MAANVPDLAIVFETHDENPLTPPPTVHIPLSSPNSTPTKPKPKPSPEARLNSSSESSDEISQKELPRSSRSRKSLPRPATDNGNRIGAPPSFAYGVLMGVLPFLIVIRFLVRKFRKADSDDSHLQERWFKYGRSVGLILLLVAIIIIVVELA